MRVVGDGAGRVRVVRLQPVARHHVQRAHEHQQALPTENKETFYLN